MKFETIEISGWEGAIKGMRNPLESWAKSDSKIYNTNDILVDVNNTEWANSEYTDNHESCIFIGPNDLDLMTRLIKAGSEHRKFLRYIHVQVDITAPQFFWSEFDTYKIGTVANSTSKMHKLASTPITLDCFEIDDYSRKAVVRCTEDEDVGNTPNIIEGMYINFLEGLRQEYLETKDIRYWKELIRWLPESWLQTRTVDLNYEVLRTIVRQRTGHKLTEWRESFINWVHTLPYADELIFSEEAIVTDAKKYRKFKKEYDQLLKIYDGNPPWEEIDNIVEKYLLEN